MRACVVLTTVGSMKEGSRLAELLVSKGLAACVNCLPGALSHYRWKGKKRVSREVLMVIKSESRLWPRLVKSLKANHPYDLPEILLLPVQKGTKEYLSWLAASLKK